jgi:hypothetical protein
MYYETEGKRLVSLRSAFQIPSIPVCRDRIGRIVLLGLVLFKFVRPRHDDAFDTAARC